MKRLSIVCVISCIVLGLLYINLASDAWVNRYGYLQEIHTLSKNFPSFQPNDEYFLVVLVDAQHRDYSTPQNYCSSMIPGILKNGPDPGHAWVILAGMKDGKFWIFEGGHTVDFRNVVKHYTQDLLGLSNDINPENPAETLFVPTRLGQLHVGPSGSHPTFAAAIPITEEGFERISRLFDDNGYDFSHWGIQGPNCVQFALSCLSAAGIDFSCYDTLAIPPAFSICGQPLPMWNNPTYSKLTLRTPDLLEKRLLDLVVTRRAFYALPWYEAFRNLCDNGLITTAEPKISAITDEVLLLETD